MVVVDAMTLAAAIDDGRWRNRFPSGLSRLWICYYYILAVFLKNPCITHIDKE
ncbi:hypothetical protein Hanom_Chr09g00793291 [Helianthus anomalus]